jgi:carbon monoxide dehydrogenase subunit G
MPGRSRVAGDMGRPILRRDGELVKHAAIRGCQTCAPVRLENSFEVAASLDDAWRLLNDVPRVVPCMPGAELTETVDENTWKGLVHVRLGPVALQFATDVTREDVDEAAHRVVLATKARELKGRGGAQATIESSLSEAEGKTKVDIVTELNLQGAVAQYGRGVVPAVASELTRQFAENIAKLLDQPDRATGTAEPEPGPAPVVPVSGFRLGVRAVFGALARLFRRSR